MTLKCILRALFLLVVYVLSINYVYAVCVDRIPGQAFLSPSIEATFSAEDFNAHPMGEPLATNTLSSTAPIQGVLNSYRLACDSNQSRSFQLWSRAQMPNRQLFPDDSFRLADGDWYGFELNEYIAVGLVGQIARYGSNQLSNCLINTSNSVPCSGIVGSRGIHPVGVTVQLYKIKNMPAGSKGFTLEDPSFSFLYGIRPYPDVEPLALVTGYFNLNFSVSGDISTPELIIDNPVVRFAGVAGDEVIQDVSVSVRNSNTQKLFPQEYTVSLLTPNRSNERTGLVGGTQFALMVNGNELRVDGDTSERWWPELEPNATSSIPLRFRFNIAGPPGQHSSILTLETEIP